MFDVMAGSGNPETWEMVADKTRQADARLIAKAPEMLTLLHELYKVIDTMGVYPWPAVLDLLEDARVLLREIEGETP